MTRVSVNFHYDPLPGGGTKMSISGPVQLSLPLDRQTVLTMAASILGCAGISEATFAGDRLVVRRSNP